MNQRETVPASRPSASIDTGKTISMRRILSLVRRSYPSYCLCECSQPQLAALRHSHAKAQSRKERRKEEVGLTLAALLCAFAALREIICQSWRPCVRRLCG